jgi:Putative DNA-binding domain
MARDLFVASIDEIEFQDISDLASTGAEEGIRLEFKGALSTSDGQPDRWMRDQSGIGRVARDDIAKEIVAFANAYGGVIIIGIDETDDHPKRAAQLASPQIPRVADCAEQLARALRSIIDPPIPMLDIRGVPSSRSSGEGAILVRVSSSPSAPHGFGVPPAAYIRQGSESKPLSMRELQSMFFERRTRLERVTSRQNELSALGQELWASRRHGATSQGDLPSLDLPAIQFRCSLVPTDDLAIDNFPDRFLGSQSQPSPRPEIGDMLVGELPPWTNEWRRRYRAVEYVRMDYRRCFFASLEADGVFNQIAIVGGPDSGPFKINPEWFGKLILQGMVMAEWFRRRASRPDVEYALGGEFWNAGAQVRTSLNLDEWDPVPWQRESVGPYSVGNRATFQETFDVIERELWDAFRLRRQKGLKFDLTKVFQSIGL